jgi:CRP-like cAMP-binding protein
MPIRRSDRSVPVTSGTTAVQTTAPRQNRILDSLPAADVALLARHLHAVTLERGLLHQQGDPHHYAYFPHDGVVSLLAMTPDGQSIEAGSIGRDAAVCPVLEFGNESFLTAITFGAVRVSRIATAHLEAVQRESAALTSALHRCRAGLLLQVRQNMLCYGLHRAEERLPRWLLETADRARGDTESIMVTQAEVGERLGLRRTTVTLTARVLQNAGAIRWGRSRIEIVDRTKLEQMACGCYAALRACEDGLLPADVQRDPAQHGFPR